MKTSTSAIQRALKEEGYTRKKGQPYSDRQNNELRVAWQADMINFTAEQLVVIDESLFKAQTGWRCMAYGPIGDSVRWSEDLRRGQTFSVLPAYTTEGYLPCTVVREGYFDNEAFFNWINNDLLPHCNAYSASRSVIVLDNVSTHLKNRIREVVEAKGCLIKYLPPYSPDLSPIELTFDLLKAWMRRHWRALRDQFQGDFKGFLRYAVQVSDCDSKAKQHFTYSNKDVGGYRFEGDYEAYQRRLEAWSNELEYVEQ